MTTASKLSSSPCLQGERVAFTGTLTSMTHKEAFEHVVAHGGIPARHVSGQTTVLVVGDEGWPLENDGRASTKFLEARQRISNREAIRILDESEWLHAIGLSSRDHAHRVYTPAMLAQLLGVPVQAIRRWERLGLIRAVRRVHRLSYFDFSEVASARRLCRLLQEGVSPERLQQSLARFVGTDRTLAQLNILVQDRQIVLRDEQGLVHAMSGQRLLDFEPPRSTDPDDEATPPAVPFSPVEDSDARRQDWSAEEWFYEGCRLADAFEPTAAVEAFRTALMTHGATLRCTTRNEASELSPHPAEISFHLADALYRAGQPQAALERYYAAVEYDPNYLESWLQLACLLNELGSTQQALDAFRIALEIHPDYADAHLYIANTLEEAGDTAGAREHWQRYLQVDSRGPWANHAQDRLEATASSPDADPRRGNVVRFSGEVSEPVATPSPDRENPAKDLSENSAAE